MNQTSFEDKLRYRNRFKNFLSPRAQQTTYHVMESKDLFHSIKNKSQKLLEKISPSRTGQQQPKVEVPPLRVPPLAIGQESNYQIFNKLSSKEDPKSQLKKGLSQTNYNSFSKQKIPVKGYRLVSPDATEDIKTEKIVFQSNLNSPSTQTTSTQRFHFFSPLNSHRNNDFELFSLKEDQESMAESSAKILPKIARNEIFTRDPYQQSISSQMNSPQSRRIQLNSPTARDQSMSFKVNKHENSISMISRHVKSQTTTQVPSGSVQPEKKGLKIRNFEKLQVISQGSWRERMYLIVVDNQTESYSRLKYCYEKIRTQQSSVTQRESAKEFEEVMERLAKKLNLGERKRVYLYLRDGREIRNLAEIPEFESTLVVSSNLRFSGLVNLKAKEQRVIQALEQKVFQHEREVQFQPGEETTPRALNLQNKPESLIEEKVRVKYRNVIDNIISTLHGRDGSANPDSQFLEGVLRNKELSLKEMVAEILKKQGESARNSRGWEYGDPESYLNSEAPLLERKKQEELEQILQYYDYMIAQSRFNEFEVQEDHNLVVLRQGSRSPNKQERSPTKRETVSMFREESELNNEIRQIAIEVGIFDKHRIDPNTRNLRSALSGTEEVQPNKYDLIAKRVMEEYELRELQSTKTIKGGGFDTQEIRYEMLKKTATLLTKMISQFYSETINRISSRVRNVRMKLTDKTVDLSRSEVEDPLLGEAPLERASKEEEDRFAKVEVDFEEVEDEQVNNDKKRRKKRAVNYLEHNKKIGKSNFETLRAIERRNKELFKNNIPKILEQIPYLLNKKDKTFSHFNREDMFQIYSIYKTLHLTTSQRYKRDDYNIEDGVDYETYRNGLYQVYMQSEELALRIFRTIDYNYSGYMDWGEFLKLMVSIRAKTVSEKINLFIKIADENGDGQLSWEEIYSLSKICLSKFIQKTNENDSFLEDLCEYFTRLIFQSSGEENYEGEIPLKNIKRAINSGHPDSHLLLMFCGADI